MSLSLAPLEDKKQNKHHKNKYEKFSKTSNHQEKGENVPAHYHPEDYPTEYHSSGVPLFTNYDNFIDEDFEDDQPEK